MAWLNRSWCCGLGAGIMLTAIASKFAVTSVEEKTEPSAIPLPNPRAMYEERVSFDVKEGQPDSILSEIM